MYVVRDKIPTVATKALIPDDTTRCPDIHDVGGTPITS